jgi:hypothetical protein
MIHHVAYVMAKAPFQDIDLNSFRLATLARWFTPWLGIDLLDGVNRSETKYESIRKGKEFTEIFNFKYLGVLKEWEKRQTPILNDEIEELKLTLSELLLTTALDSDMIDVVLRKDRRKLLSSGTIDPLLFCIQDKI